MDGPLCSAVFMGPGGAVVTLSRVPLYVAADIIKRLPPKGWRITQSIVHWGEPTEGATQS